jgi:hypothetical protein
VVVFGARQERLRAAPLEVREGSVSGVAFGPAGRLAVGYQRGPGGGVVVFDARRKRLRHAPLEVPEGRVSSVAFGPEGQLAAVYSVVWGPKHPMVDGVFRGGGGVVVFDARGQRLLPAPLEVQEGSLMSVAFGPMGQLATGYGKEGVVLFDVDRGSWRRKAGLVANRNFTRLEWTRYFPETSYRRTIRSVPWPHDLLEAERIQAEAFEKEHPEGSPGS